MEILHQYYYHKGVAVAKTAGYVILSVAFVALGLFCFIHWDLSFMFDDWHGYVILIVYGLITLGTILSTVENFRRTAKARQGIPAFAVGADFFVFYDNDGLATTVPFADCDYVKFKTVLEFRIPTLKLFVKYHEPMDPYNTLRYEVKLKELDCPIEEIDEQLNDVYQKYKKEHPDQ